MARVDSAVGGKVLCTVRGGGRLVKFKGKVASIAPWVGVAVVMGLGAPTVAQPFTGADITDGSLTGLDIQDGSILLNDLGPNSVTPTGS